MYPEGFGPAHHGEPEVEVLRHVLSGPRRARRAAEGGQRVNATSRSEGARDFYYKKYKNICMWLRKEKMES